MSNQSPAGSSSKEKRPHVIRIEPSPRTILTFLGIIASLWVLNRPRRGIREPSDRA